MYTRGATVGLSEYPIVRPFALARKVRGCGKSSYEYGSSFSYCQMRDDHQSFVPGGPWKSGVTLGLVFLWSWLPPTSTPSGGWVTKKPLPTAPNGTPGADGIGRASCNEGPHAPAPISARAVSTSTPRENDRRT